MNGWWTPRRLNYMGRGCQTELGSIPDLAATPEALTEAIFAVTEAAIDKNKRAISSSSSKTRNGVVP